MAGLRATLRSLVKHCITGYLIGVTVTDRYAFLSSVHGSSMHPTFVAEIGEFALVERFCLDRYDFSRGDVVVFRSPTDHRTTVVKRVIGLPGDWIQVPQAADIRQTPVGHCWVEGDNGSVSWDSRGYGPVTHSNSTTPINFPLFRVISLCYTQLRYLRRQNCIDWWWHSHSCFLR